VSRKAFEPPRPGALTRLPRIYSAFALPAGFDRIRFTLEVRGLSNGVVVLNAEATGPWLPEHTPVARNGVRYFWLKDGKPVPICGPDSGAELRLCGDREAGAMFAAFFDGRTTLGIVADWIEDDAADRVKSARHHEIDAHKLDPDPVRHFLTLMRCYRDGRKPGKPKRPRRRDPGPLPSLDLSGIEERPA
jgi:hypothetical protein